MLSQHHGPLPTQGEWVGRWALPGALSAGIFGASRQKAATLISAARLRFRDKSHTFRQQKLQKPLPASIPRPSAHPHRSSFSPFPRLPPPSPPVKPELTARGKCCCGVPFPTDLHRGRKSTLGQGGRVLLRPHCFPLLRRNLRVKGNYFPQQKYSSLLLAIRVQQCLISLSFCLVGNL